MLTNIVMNSFFAKFLPKKHWSEKVKKNWHFQTSVSANIHDAGVAFQYPEPNHDPPGLTYELVYMLINFSS